MTSAKLDRLVWTFIVLLGLVGGTLAMIGWLNEPQATGGDWRNALYRTLLFFKLDKHHGEFAETNGALLWAQVLCPVATFTVMIRVGVQLFTTELSRWITAHRSQHVVICGLGEQGSTFAETLRQRDKSISIVAIESAPNAGHDSFCRLHDIRLVRGDCRDAKVLEAGAASKASSVIIVTPDDNKNLETAMVVRDLVAAQSRRQGDLTAYIGVRNWTLWNELSNSDAVQRSAVNFEMRPFSLPVLAARKFFWNEPLYSFADIRTQPRIHVVFCGFDDYAASLLIQMLHCCVYKSFAPSAATILTRNADEERRKFMRRYPEVMVDRPEIGVVGALQFQEFDLAADGLDDSVMASIEARAGVTAVVVCQASDDVALSSAVMINDAMRRHGRWKAATYVRMNSGTGGADIFVPPEDALRFSDVVMPFGTKQELCDTALIDGALESVARKIHDTYQATRRLRYASSEAVEREESTQDWRTLRETYRKSNRRAADHIKAKLASAGCYVPPGFNLTAPSDLHIGESAGMIEALSQVEHRSWSAGMRVDGWRPGAKRDNARKIHDNLVPYERLTEAIKEYDRDQVRQLDAAMLERADHAGDMVRDDHWIGLIGRNSISAEDAAWLRRELTERLLPRLLARHPSACFTVVTPLAPGSDYVLADATVHFLRDKGVVHRLLVVEGVPESAMIEDYRETWSGRAAWNGQARQESEIWEDSAAPHKAVRGQIAKARLDLFRTASEILGPRASWIVDLTEPGVDYADRAAREQGYRRAADYVAERCTTLFAASDSEAARKTGGTNDTLARRADGALAAADVWPRKPLTAAVRLDLRQRAVQGG